MWCLFIIVHHRHFQCPCALHCTGNNGWPCPWFTPRPYGCSSAVCLQVVSNVSALWYFDLIKLGFKGLRWREALGLFCSVLWGSLLPFSIGQWPKESGKLKWLVCSFVICTNVPQGLSNDHCEFPQDASQIETPANRFERIANHLNSPMCFSIFSVPRPTSIILNCTW